MKYNETLEEVANEYVTQDNRGTAFPIGYIITEMEEVRDEYGDYFYIGVDNDYDSYEDIHDENILKWAYEVAEVEEVEHYDQYPDEHCDEISKRSDIKEEFDDIYGFSDLKAFVEEHCDDSANMYRFNKERVYRGNQMFLTQSGAQAHIRENGHNMKEPRDYLIRINRNHEMTMIIHDLMKRATVPQEEWNHEALYYYNRKVKEVGE